MAITVDGKIAKDKSQLADWTSREDKKFFVEISKQHGVIMMGENTFKTFPAPLPGRLNVVFSRADNPPPITGVKWVKGEPADVLAELEKMGHTSALLGGGAALNSLFLEKKLISEIILTVEPKIFGAGLSLFNKDLEANLKLLEVKKLNDNTLMLHYQVLS
ncbi:MAG: Bifunctional deaminase-reductase domain protein [Candidatus Falkowbacteria bacterium GW2011_GWF2_43_32]|nr:MAG: Bifunctional deaminase-reductase domain protein [Candidatus Falkowbacteria bacterium GW2011_GWF2_43_32]